MKARPERVFMYRLARELGMTVGRLEAEADSREIAEWLAFFAIDEEERDKPKPQDPRKLSDKIKASLGAFRHGKKSR